MCMGRTKSSRKRTFSSPIERAFKKNLSSRTLSVPMELRKIDSVSRTERSPHSTQIKVLVDFDDANRVEKISKSVSDIVDNLGIDTSNGTIDIFSTTTTAKKEKKKRKPNAANLQEIDERETQNPSDGEVYVEKVVDDEEEYDVQETYTEFQNEFMTPNTEAQILNDMNQYQKNRTFLEESWDESVNDVIETDISELSDD